MSTAKRRINSTGRKRITRDHVDIRMLEPRPGEALRAKAALSLDAYGFPASSAVSIEAYHRSSGMRFDCGTIESPSIPPVLVLDEVDRAGSVLFRVKVTDTNGDIGRILGSAERVQPINEETEDGKKSLLPVVYRDLREQIWKVEINDGDRPKLILNREIPGISQKLHDNPLLQAFLFPAALRIVLEQLVQKPDEDDDEEPGWKSEWLQFCREGLGLRDDPTTLDEEAKFDWVERAIDSFCAMYKFVDGVRKAEGDGTGI